ncbi:TerB N-terminal domain-containing protein [Janthinobacterium sp. PSPC3-1]|uniref:TerB N-terminal domain-containing protein n=1 Tax=Janthinobacterium sp. PSPC3-1 TaxID=2804653 RepID=UPI003CF3568B
MHFRQHGLLFYLALVAGIVVVFLMLFFGRLAGLISVCAGILYVYLRYRIRRASEHGALFEQDEVLKTISATCAASGTAGVLEETTTNESKATSMVQYSSDDAHSSSEAAGFRIPPPPAEPIMARWFARNDAVTVAGLSIPSGMVYVGERLPGQYGTPDPCLIDPLKTVDLLADYNEAHTHNDWPNYSDVSPRARGAYLKWLADGRSGPEADIANIWLFFFGLERRVLLDYKFDKALASELPQIAKELLRLLKHYGKKSSLFHRQCSDFLEIVNLLQAPPQLYLQAMPEFPAGAVMPMYLRLAIGQAVADQQPIPVQLAWAWVQHEPSIMLRTAAIRCPEQFHALFLKTYVAKHGDRIKIRPTATRLKCVYMPASYAMRGTEGIVVETGDVPDVRTMDGPVNFLQKVVDACAAELDAYSRFVGRFPEQRHALEALVHLPLAIWPPSAMQALHDIRTALADGAMALPLASLASRFNAQAVLSSEIVNTLVNALASVQVATEPELSTTGKHGGDQVVALFLMPVAHPDKGAPVEDPVATLALELLIMQAQLNDVFSDEKLVVLDAQIASWTQLPTLQQRRLMARARLLRQEPLLPTAMRRKVAAAGEAAREACAAFIVRIAGTAAHMPRAEVAVLERLYAFLDVDSKKLYVALHGSAMAPATNHATVCDRPPAGVVTLDIARIAQLHSDNEKLAVLLGNIFVDDPVPEPAAIVPASTPASGGVPGLDAAHTAFMRQLLARSSWPRSELEALARSLDMMLDGALEHLNEACLDAYDCLCSEGNDPIDINPDIHERIAP